MITNTTKSDSVKYVSVQFLNEVQILLQFQHKQHINQKFSKRNAVRVF